MGRWNWWLPRPLERVLPDTNFEGSGRRQRQPQRPQLLRDPVGDEV